MIGKQRSSNRPILPISRYRYNYVYITPVFRDMPAALFESRGLAIRD